jgi:hypothetical protein
MKKITSLFLTVLMLAMFSCATEEHVKNVVKNPNQMMSTFKVTPSNSQINSTDTISISVPNVADATIYYEIAKGDDCKDPTTASAKFTGDFALSSKISDAQYGDKITLKILAVKEGYDDATTTCQWFYVGGTKPTPNDNAFLSSVTVSGATFTFSPDKYVYDISVPKDVENATINYIKEDNAATVEYSVHTLDNLPLIGGRTTLVALIVTSSDGSVKKRYLLSIYRPGKNDPDLKSSNCYLSTLNVEGGFIVFDKTKTTYNVTLPSTVEKTRISYQTEHSKASAYMNGGAAEFSIAQGATEERKITVTAEAGNTMEYTVSVYRQSDGPLSDDATLKSLSVTGGSLAFASATTKYDVTIPADYTGAVSVAYEANHPAATVISNQSNLTNIVSFPATVTINVTAEDKTSIMVYTINITKASGSVIVDNNANLDSITLSAGSLTPVFSTTTTEYTVDVEYTVSSVTVTATPESSKATVVVTPSGDVSLTSGVATPITINVTAEDGTPKTYIVNVTRAPIPVPPGPNPVPTPVPSTGEYYWTNKNGAVGTNKTIKSWSDWTEAERIAQNAAYDDPRTWMGIQEVSYDVYALYAAWDNDNLYVMVELVNGVDRAKDLFMWHDYASSDNAWWDNRDIPLGMLFNTGKGAKSNKPTVDQGGPIWGSVDFSDAQGFDVMFYHSSKYGYAEHKSAFVGVGTPGFFTTTSAGVFSYGAENCKKFAGATADGSGVHVRYMRKCAVSSKIYMESTPNDNRGTSGQDGAALLASTTYKEFGTTDLDMSYWYTIPLKSLGIDKAHIESKGIGIRQLTTNGGSLMDCSPWDVSMVDVATDPCSDDASTSAEKEDVDDITSAQARIGKM